MEPAASPGAARRGALARPRRLAAGRRGAPIPCLRRHGRPRGGLVAAGPGTGLGAEQHLRRHRRRRSTGPCSPSSRADPSVSSTEVGDWCPARVAGARSAADLALRCPRAVGADHRERDFAWLDELEALAGLLFDVRRVLPARLLRPGGSARSAPAGPRGLQTAVPRWSYQRTVGTSINASSTSTAPRIARRRAGPVSRASGSGRRATRPPPTPGGLAATGGGADRLADPAGRPGPGRTCRGGPPGPTRRAPGATVASGHTQPCSALNRGKAEAPA